MAIIFHCWSSCVLLAIAMVRQPCCDKLGLQKGPWTAQEDLQLVSFISSHGHGCWRQLPKLAGLLRCGKSCRLRWTNYLRPDLKRGALSESEERLIIQVHAAIGNRWSRIAAHLPGRTDNEIKNYWNTRIKKKLKQMGIDPTTHKPLQAAAPAKNCQQHEAPPRAHSEKFMTPTLHRKYTDHTLAKPSLPAKLETDMDHPADQNVNTMKMALFKSKLGAQTTLLPQHVSKLEENFEPSIMNTISPARNLSHPTSITSFPQNSTRSDEDSETSVCTRELVESKPDFRPQNLDVQLLAFCHRDTAFNPFSPSPSNASEISSSFMGNTMGCQQRSADPYMTAGYPAHWSDLESDDGVLNRVYDSIPAAKMDTNSNTSGPAWTMQQSDFLWGEASELHSMSSVSQNLLPDLDGFVSILDGQPTSCNSSGR